MDPGASNTAAGHRRWILNPASGVFGAGSTDNSYALAVFASDVATMTNPSTPSWVPSPTAGYFPHEQEPRGRWSFSRARMRWMWLVGRTVAQKDGRSYRIRRRDAGRVVRLRVVLTEPGYARAVAWSNRVRVRARR